eukprot:163161-Pleurochrysis_carterae.AAC.2
MGGKTSRVCPREQFADQAAGAAPATAASPPRAPPPPFPSRRGAATETRQKRVGSNSANYSAVRSRGRKKDNLGEGVQARPPVWTESLPRRPRSERSHESVRQLKTPSRPRSIARAVRGTHDKACFEASRTLASPPAPRLRPWPECSETRATAFSACCQDQHAHTRHADFECAVSDGQTSL